MSGWCKYGWDNNHRHTDIHPVDGRTYLYALGQDVMVHSPRRVCLPQRVVACTANEGEKTDSRISNAKKKIFVATLERRI